MSGHDAVAGSGWFRFEPPLVLRGGDLDGFVGRTLPGSRAVSVEYLDQGVVNSNYKVEVATAEAPLPMTLLLRLSRSDEGPLREGAIGRRIGNAPGLAVRQLIGSERGDLPEPHRRSLFSWIPGESLDSIAALPEPRLEGAATSLAAALARVHGIRFNAFGRLDSGLDVINSGNQAHPAGRWADDLSRRVATRLDNPAHGLDRAGCERVRAGFARLLSRIRTAPIPASLVHGDLSAGNILVVPDAVSNEWRLSGLIDWEMARSADPAWDFASLRFELRKVRPLFSGVVESCYRNNPDAAAWAGPETDWEARVGLASVPILLDARMVAARRRAHELLKELDRLIEAALPG